MRLTEQLARIETKLNALLFDDATLTRATDSLRLAAIRVRTAGMALSGTFESMGVVVSGRMFDGRLVLDLPPPQGDSGWLDLRNASGSPNRTVAKIILWTQSSSGHS